MTASPADVAQGPPRDHELEADVLGSILSCAEIASWRGAVRESLSILSPGDFDSTWHRRAFDMVRGLVDLGRVARRPVGGRSGA